MKFVSEDALARRIRRKLNRKGWQLYKVRWDSRWIDSTGRYTISNERNHAVDTHVDIEDYGRRLGVLKDFESMGSPETQPQVCQVEILPPSPCH